MRWAAALSSRVERWWSTLPASTHSYGDHVLGRLALRPIVGRRLDPPRQRGDDRRGHLVLDREDVLEVAIVALGPDMVVGIGVDQLHGDPHPVARLAHAAFDHVLDAELRRDVLDLDRLALVDEGRVARDHEQLPEPRQLGDDVLGQAVGEEFLLGVAAHVGERQHRDRGLLRRRLARCARRPRLDRGRLGAVEAHPEDAERAGDVLDGLLALVLERDVEAVADLDLVADRARHADAARLGQLLQARGDVDAIAEDVVVLEDHVAEVDADAELDPARRRHIRVAPRHPALDLDRTLHRVGDALKLDQEAVAGGLDDPAAVLGDRRVDQLEPVGPQARKRAGLVGLHQPAVADHVGGEDRGEPAFDTAGPWAQSSRGPRQRQTVRSDRPC